MQTRLATKTIELGVKMRFAKSKKQSRKINAENIKYNGACLNTFQLHMLEVNWIAALQKQKAYQGEVMLKA